MAKNQEILIFYFALSFIAEKRMLMDFWLERLNTAFFTKRTEKCASFASPVKLLKTSKNKIPGAQILPIVFSVATTYFLHRRLVFFKIDVVHRSSVVLEFW